MKTQAIVFLIENWYTILVFFVVIIVFFLMYSFEQEREAKQQNIKRSQKSFSLANIDLKSSRIGAIFLLLLIFSFCLLC